jgi:hypothetical protein
MSCTRADKSSTTGESGGTSDGTWRGESEFRILCRHQPRRLVAVSPPKPPLAAASSGGPGGTACPGRLATGSGDPARSRAFKPAGDCPSNHRPLSSVQDGGAFSGAAIGGQRAAGLSRRGGGPGGGRSRPDRTLMTPEQDSDEASCADTFRMRCDSSASHE